METVSLFVCLFWSFQFSVFSKIIYVLPIISFSECITGLHVLDILGFG